MWNNWKENFFGKFLKGLKKNTEHVEQNGISTIHRKWRCQVFWHGNFFVCHQIPRNFPFNSFCQWLAEQKAQVFFISWMARRLRNFQLIARLFNCHIQPREAGCLRKSAWSAVLRRMKKLFLVWNCITTSANHHQWLKFCFICPEIAMKKHQNRL